MIRLSGLRSPIAFVPEEGVYGGGYEDIPRRVPDIRRMREILGAAPRVRLDDGLKRTMEWFHLHGPETEQP